MAIEIGLRLGILSAQNELNLRIGDNIGRTGPENAPAAKPVTTIADAMPDPSEAPERDETPPAPREEPRLPASASLAGLRPPAQAVRAASLREMASLPSARPEPEGTAVRADRMVGRTAADRSTAATMTAGRSSAEAPGSGAGPVDDDPAADARFGQAFAALMRTAPSSPTRSLDMARPLAVTADETKEPDPDVARSSAEADGSPEEGKPPVLDAGLPRERAPEPSVSTRRIAATDRRTPDAMTERAASLDPAAADPTRADRSAPTGTSHGALDASIVGTAALGERTSDIDALADRLFVAAMAQGEGTPLPERAGVIASFVLNAAMIPGWPPPRPLEGAPLEVMTGLVAVSKDLTEADKELLLYLANMGFSRKHLMRLLRKLEAAKNKSKLLKGLAMLLTNVAAAAAALADEVTTLLEDGPEDAAAMARTASGRARLDLR